MIEEVDKIQIVAFSTNQASETPNDIITAFLSPLTHKILKKNRHSIAFSLTMPNASKPTKVMICTVLNLEREYTGITDVNCYILFVDLQKEDSNEQLHDIINYMKEYCDETKKIFVIGTQKSQDNTNYITEKDIRSKMDSFGKKYEFHQMNLESPKEISDYLIGVLDYSKKHQIHDEEEESVMEEKDKGQSGSCYII